MKKYKFPNGFLWGSATSAYQIEGGLLNDWTEWEKANAERLAEEAKDYWQKWQQEKFPEMLDQKNYISGLAADHYDLYKEDIKIVKELGQNAFRFSIEWSRIEPEEGKFNEKEIEHYKDVLKNLKENGIEPFVTLYHWPVPLWFRDKGSWEHKDAPKYFNRYVRKVVSELKDDVNFWITINEPDIYAAHSYLKGGWPPQKKNPMKFLKVMNSLINAHKLAYATIKKADERAQIGISKHNVYFEAYQNKPINVFLKKIADWIWNFYTFNKINNYQDFMGLNNYHHNRIDFGFNKNENKKVSDMGWELYPESLYYVLIDLKKYGKPVYITENGIADRNDSQREWFIIESLKSVHRAIEDGVDVKGYLYWSLLDNFEWDKGFWPRFGLVDVNYKTMERKIRPSALKYAKICRSNELEL